MAARKPMMGPTPERNDLEQQVKEALAKPLTDDEFDHRRQALPMGMRQTRISSPRTALCAQFIVSV